jgi:hypothetical protein
LSSTAAGGEAGSPTAEVNAFTARAGRRVEVINAGVNIGVRGNASAFVDLAFGFDTYGITKVVNSGRFDLAKGGGVLEALGQISGDDVLTVLDGFYVNDWTMPTIENDKVVAGKADYMSPEQANFQITDQRSDLFSAGRLCRNAFVCRCPLVRVSRHLPSSRWPTPFRSISK